METTALQKALQNKEAIADVLLMSQVLLLAVKSLPREIQQSVPEDMLKLQQRLMPLLPPQTQQFISRQLTKDIFGVLPVAIRNHIRAKSEGHGNMYERLNILMEYLAHHKRFASKALNEEKYKLLLEFIEDEITAEITEGKPALSAIDGQLVIGLAKPCPGTKKIDHD